MGKQARNCCSCRTNSDPCLVNPAIATAKTFKWQPDANAPDTQIGFVVVNFQVGE